MEHELAARQREGEGRRKRRGCSPRQWYEVLKGLAKSVVAGAVADIDSLAGRRKQGRRSVSEVGKGVQVERSEEGRGEKD